MRSTCLGRLGLVLPGEGKVFGRELASHPSCSCRKKFKNAPRQLGPRDHTADAGMIS
ncbi:uncharacterized protein PHALS_08135 [Plasmopara halstedii]|uniref:Uncharacterized protein n=1 Tax=Plasmopara halstedii TaxID=4781 RepID=A0A0P1B793_PLAHL|nr:uncharacterized protein PHALS_08135 [Plasmopara halstedii]CEG50423.1 hypothetical protein PHALS_08135 [Plasmopara halstedii]|eukprot:XP_024586792.1 hypothetical protein PHALS_08135 [Plasmopara halstedii]